MNRTFLLLGSVLAALAVGLGAIGSHTMKQRISAEMLEVWKTAAQYHLIHAVALVIVALLCAHADGKAMRAAGWLFFVGILIFGGTLYILAATGIKWLGAITPLGGLSFILGWVCLAVAARRS